MINPFLKRIIYEWRVKGGVLGLIFVFFLSKPNKISLLSGIGLCIVGLLLRTWASGHLRKEKKLTISGPYKYTRNPLYLANLIIGIGITAGSWSLWVAGIFAFYFPFFYIPVIKKEKEKMNSLFPEKYDDYKTNVPLFFPSLKPYPDPEKAKFKWSHYKKNREYRALLGAILFWLTMILRFLLIR